MARKCVKNIKEIVNMTYIGYGIGQYYSIVKPELDKLGIELSFLCDRKWKDASFQTYDGIPIIQKEEIVKIPDAVCVIFSMHYMVTNSIVEDLSKEGIAYKHVDELLGRIESKVITGKQLKEECQEGLYTDFRNNRIYFDETIPEGLKITFRGNNNTLRIGKNLMIGKLGILFGDDGSCIIGDYTEIIDAYFCIAYAGIMIGSDCLLAPGVILRTHDGHHIFDLHTHKRLNSPEEITIGNQVWIARGATLLSGARIGTGSVVAANAVTSSTFPEHCIIAGVPAKVIREGICWSRDESSISNHEYLEECNSQAALKYIE